MNLNLVLPFLSTIVMAVFVVSVLHRYFVRRSAFFLFWGIGLAMFGLGSFAEAYLAVLPFNAFVFFIWYVFGAALNAAWIGQGTVMLLARRPPVRWLTSSLLIAGSFVVIAVWFSMALDASRVIPGEPVSLWYRNIMPPDAAVRKLTPIFNIYGLVTLAGGALWSGYLFWRKRVLPNRVIGNVLIAVGALAIGSASTLTRFGIGEYLYMGELLAATLMYIGFRQAGAPAPTPKRQEAAAQAR